MRNPFIGIGRNSSSLLSVTYLVYKYHYLELKRKEYFVRSVPFMAGLIVKEAELRARHSDYILKEKTQWL